MAWNRAASAAMLGLLLAGTPGSAQKAPATADRPWVPSPKQQLSLEATRLPKASEAMEPARIYTLAELVDLAEQHNPATRSAWQNAKARAADLGIAKSALYPTLAAAAMAQTTRTNILINTSFPRQTIGSFAPALAVDYTVFDFGARNQRISISSSNLLAANFTFNDTHRRVIFAVQEAYYRLLNANGQRTAAEATLKNAQTDQEAAEARLAQGLATLPDVLEARSATAQADYDLQSTIGAGEIAHGELANALGLSPTTTFQVQSIAELRIPGDLEEPVEQAIDRALAQRPDLLAKVADVRATQAEISIAKAAFLPLLSFDGRAGWVRAYGQQDLLPGVYSRTNESWDARLNLTWTLFDGGAREHELARAKADRKRAEAEVETARDQIENEVWAAYANTRTALRQQRAAAALLEASSESYQAALESYKYGVRNQIDVVSAQRTLAQARTADVTARTQLLSDMADLAFRTGDLLRAGGP